MPKVILKNDIFQPISFLIVFESQREIDDFRRELEKTASRSEFLSDMGTELWRALDRLS